jgi:hypothetical protein
MSTKVLYQNTCLYGLVFLKVCAPSEEVHCAIGDWPSAKTFCEKSWHIIECIADLKESVIKLDNRVITAPPINGHIRGALLVIDCTDCKINEPFPFCSKWMSQKFKGPGLKYEGVEWQFTQIIYVGTLAHFQHIEMNPECSQKDHHKSFLVLNLLNATLVQKEMSGLWIHKKE